MSKACVVFAAFVLALLLMAEAPERAEAMQISHFFGAMPIVSRGTSVASSWATGTDAGLSFTRAIDPHVLMTGSITAQSSLDLRLCLKAPLELAPAFLALELSPSRMTGLMTLFLGPVALDLGRTWFDPVRWVIVQVAVHPQLTLFVMGEERGGRILPYAGFRWFPEETARWEIGFRGGSEAEIWLGGSFP
jgi:hypothetical protein